MIDIKKLLVDCDPGIDDALAILFALLSKEVVLEGISAVYGNATVEQTAENVLKVLELASLRKLPPVAIGSKGPLKGSRVELRTAHGRDGLGDTRLRTPKIKASLARAAAAGRPFRGQRLSDSASLFAARIGPGAAHVLVTLGPLTNVARFFEERPDLASTLEGIYVMAGALRVEGSVTRWAEFNAYNDPWALDMVLGSGLPVTLVSLDVTRGAMVAREDLARFADVDNERANFVVKALTHYIDFHESERRTRGAYMHDPLCMALAIDEGLGEYEELPIGVDCSQEKRGMLYIDKGRPAVRFCKRVDSGKFLRSFLDRLHDFIIPHELAAVPLRRRRRYVRPAERRS